MLRSTVELMHLVILCVTAFLLSGFNLKGATIRPPGTRPKALGIHALTGGRVYIKPGLVSEGATILIKDGRIENVLPHDKSSIPEGYRVWDMKGKTVYAGFIDPYYSSGKKAKPVSNRWVTPIDARAGVNFTGLPTTKEDMGKKGPGYEIAEVQPHYKVSETLTANHEAFEKLRELGFTAANFIPAEGIIRGSATLSLLGEGDPNDLILTPKTTQHFAYEPGKEYPKSLMGVIAVIRQAAFDTQHYMRMQKWAMKNPSGIRPEYNPALQSMAQVIADEGQKQLTIVEPGSVLMISRTAALAEELGIDPVIVATGHEWRRRDILEKVNFPFIVTVSFPAIPELPDEEDWKQVSLDELRTWDWAPEVPALIAEGDRDMALTLHGLSDYKSFRKNVRRAIQRGLKEETALAALTTIPAKLTRSSSFLGTIEKGRLANLTVVDGDSWFDPDNPISSVWIEGRHYPVNTLKKAKKEEGKPDALKKENKPRAAKTPGDYRGALRTPENIVIRNATIWTCGPSGVITNSSLRIIKGRVSEIGDVVGPSLEPGTVIIDGTGKHITPGLIDCHNHSMILGGVNEGTLPSSAMVRISDVVNSETENIYRQLAGGLTIANLLHGSANPIGGQNAVIKLRHGELPDDLIFKEAPPGIKFALGENVKQSNWSNEKKTRFPQTRMGVKTFFNNRFTAARQYVEQLEIKNGNLPPVRRNLELEALGQILKGDRLIHCHSYRQDEMLVFLRTMERFGVRVGTLQHVLEGYKIADEIAAHGAGASSFSDWWAYKFEVYDAIPYNGSLLQDRGAVVSFNSDSSDLARRMNLEAAKAVKYGGTSEEDALKFVTLNPAKQLKIDKWVGSLEVGKHADFVIWTGHPLSTQTLCEETWIEGRQYYSRSHDAKRSRLIALERTNLLLKAREKEGKEQASATARAAFFRRAMEKSHSLNNCHQCKKEKP